MEERAIYPQSRLYPAYPLAGDVVINAAVNVYVNVASMQEWRSLQADLQRMAMAVVHSRFRLLQTPYVVPAQSAKTRMVEPFRALSTVLLSEM